MKDWNTVVTLYQEEGGFRRARHLLKQLGDVATTGFYNVLVMRIDNVKGFLRDFSAMCDAEPGILDDISRAVPLTDTFDFENAREFEDKARTLMLSLAPRLHGSTFHVRLHRRGMGDELSSLDEEKFLDDVLLSALKEAGAPGHVKFDDADFVIDVEIVGPRAGLSLWTRDDLHKFKFLKVD